jgi:hypothetical protein
VLSTNGLLVWDGRYYLTHLNISFGMFATKLNVMYPCVSGRVGQTLLT